MSTPTLLRDDLGRTWLETLAAFLEDYEHITTIGGYEFWEGRGASSHPGVFVAWVDPTGEWMSTWLRFFRHEWAHVSATAVDGYEDALSFARALHALIQ